MQSKQKKSFMEKLQPRDVIGGLTLLFGLGLTAKGINSTVSFITIMVATFYFTRRLTKGENGKD